jgi:hypothetical protein
LGDGILLTVPKWAWNADEKARENLSHAKLVPGNPQSWEIPFLARSRLNINNEIVSPSSTWFIIVTNSTRRKTTNWKYSSANNV